MIFDITKTVVVDDFETLVYGKVDYIDSKTYKIERRYMDIPVSHTDGCGMILPRVNDKNFMIRLPWVKGLLSPFAFDVFCKENNIDGDIVDMPLVDDMPKPCVAHDLQVFVQCDEIVRMFALQFFGNGFA